LCMISIALSGSVLVMRSILPTQKRYYTDFYLLDNRFHHNNHKIHSTYMSGSSLADLGARFLANADIELKSLDIGEEWTNIEDFNVIVQKTLFRASVTAIFGPHLLRLNPRFVEDYWLWDQSIASLFKGYPRWLIPKVYEARERLIEGIEKWHRHGEEHFDWEDEEVAKTEWEEYFGSKLYATVTLLPQNKNIDTQLV